MPRVSFDGPPTNSLHKMQCRYSIFFEGESHFRWRSDGEVTARVLRAVPHREGKAEQLQGSVRLGAGAPRPPPLKRRVTPLGSTAMGGKGGQWLQMQCRGNPMGGLKGCWVKRKKKKQKKKEFTVDDS